ncbi:MAG: hypothetical protein K0S08_519 [Gammaproteobacteria bacterium]|jgi:hypothetical protein|nr:hypothetical protein [Gammaproteobacteria bacterium]
MNSPTSESEITISLPPTPETPLMQGQDIPQTTPAKLTASTVIAQTAAGAVSAASGIGNTYVAAALETTDWPLWQQLLIVGAVGAFAYILSTLTNKGLNRCLSKKPALAVNKQVETSPAQRVGQIATHTVGAVLNGGAQIGAKFVLDATATNGIPLPIIFLIIAGCGLAGYAVSATAQAGLDKCLAPATTDEQTSQTETADHCVTPIPEKRTQKIPGTPWSQRRVASARRFGSQVFDAQIGTPDSQGFAEVLFTPEIKAEDPPATPQLTPSDEHQQPERSCCLL